MNRHKNNSHIAPIRAIATVILMACFAVRVAQAATRYVVTNDDFSGNFTPNTLTFYTVQANGYLVLTKKVQVGVLWLWHGSGHWRMLDSRASTPADPAAVTPVATERAACDEGGA